MPWCTEFITPAALTDDPSRPNTGDEEGQGGKEDLPGGGYHRDLGHWHAGRSISQVARSLGVDRDTVRKYVAPAVAAGIVPGSPPLSPQRWQELVSEWFPALVTTELRHPRFGEIAPYHQLIREQLKVNTASTVWQRLRDERGLQASVASFRRYIWATMPDREALRGTVTVRKPDPPPGEEAQLDYGYLGLWTDPATGKRRRVWGVRHGAELLPAPVVRPLLAMPLSAWIEAHVAALGFFGGAPRRLVTDNLKASVISPDLYDPSSTAPTLSWPAITACSSTLPASDSPRTSPRGTADPLRARQLLRGAGLHLAAGDATGRGRLEPDGRRARGVPAAGWPAAAGGVPPGRAGGAAAAARRAVRAGRLGTPEVHADCHVQVAGSLYSVPWRLVGRHVDARVTPQLVEVFCDGQLVKTHARVPKGRRRTDWADYPAEKVAFLERTPAWCRQRAAEAGGQVARLVAELLAGVRCTTCTPPKGCCGLATATGPGGWTPPASGRWPPATPSYRTVKGILARRQGPAPAPGPARHSQRRPGAAARPGRAGR